MFGNGEPDSADSGVTAEAVPLFGDDFRLDPHAMYEKLRAMWGPVAPVLVAPGLPAWLVLGYYEVVGVCRGRLFSRDTRLWADLRDGLVPRGTAVPPELPHRPGLAFAEGEEHARLRHCLVEALERLDPREAARHIEDVAGALIDAFAPMGRADLVGQFARPLPAYVLGRVLGVPEDRLGRFAGAVLHGADAAADSPVDDALARELAALVEARRAAPGGDLTSHLLGNPAGLADDEVVWLLHAVVRRGDSPVADLLAGTLRRLIPGPAQGRAEAVRVEDTVDQVLWADPPLQNGAPRVASSDALLGRAEIVAGDLMLMGLAAANTDPALGRGEAGPGADGLPGRRAHLAWGAGPYRCPAQRLGRQLVTVGARVLLARLTAPRLAVADSKLERRDSPLAPGLAALPVVFDPGPPDDPDRSLPPAELAADEPDPEPEFVNPFNYHPWHHS